MKSIRKNTLLILVVFAMSILTGCGGLTEEEAVNYVQAVLDASYKGEFDAYIEETDSTLEEAEKMFDENVEATLEESGFIDLNLHDELVNDYKNLFIDMAKLVDYEITDVTKNEDNNFIIEVTVRPLDIYDGVEEEITNTLTAKIMDMKELPNDEEIVEMSFEIMYDILNQKLDEPVYEDSTTVVLRLEANSENEYTINEDDILTLDKALYVSEF